MPSAVLKTYFQYDKLCESLNSLVTFCLSKVIPVSPKIAFGDEIHNQGHSFPFHHPSR